MFSGYRGQLPIQRQPVSWADQQAINDGFKSAADKEANRMMRNQLEMQAALVGYADPYSLVEGPLTNTAALQAAWNKLPKTPAPKQSQQAAPQDQLQIAQLTKEAQEYRSQAEKTISEAQAKIAELSNEELQRQKATELQQRLAIQAQAQSQASQARGGMAPSLKIATAAQTPQTAGTQAFRRRKDQFTMAPIQSTAGINVPTGSVLNI